jgi:hypothetical protein
MAQIAIAAVKNGADIHLFLTKDLMPGLGIMPDVEMPVTFRPPTSENRPAARLLAVAP